MTTSKDIVLARRFVDALDKIEKYSSVKSIATAVIKAPLKYNRVSIPIAALITGHLLGKLDERKKQNGGQ